MADSPGLWRRAKAFVRHSTLRQKLATPFLIVALGLARATVLTFPFKVYAPVLGTLAEDNAIAAEPASRSDGFRAQRIGKLIEAVAQFTPWSSNCLAQAIVASLCLRALGIGYSVHFGVARKDGGAPMEAHSWVMVGEHPVTGFEESVGMTCLRTFRLEPS